MTISSKAIPILSAPHRSRIAAVSSAPAGLSPANVGAQKLYESLGYVQDTEFLSYALEIDKP